MANDEIANAVGAWDATSVAAPSYQASLEDSIASVLADKTQVQQVKPSNANEISSAGFESAYKGLYEGAKANEVTGINNAMLEAQSPEQRQIYNQNQIASLQKQNEYLSQAKDHENKYAEAVHLGLVGAIMGIFDKDYDADYQAIMANNARAGANTEAKIGQNQAQEQAISLLTANGVNPITKGWTSEVDQWAQQYSQQLTAQKEANARKAAGANDAYKAVTDRLVALRQMQTEANEPRKQIMAEAQSRRDAGVRLTEETGRNERSVRDAEVQRETNQLNLTLEEGRNARLKQEIADNKAQREYLYKALGQKTTEMFLNDFRKAEGNRIEWAKLEANRITSNQDLQKALINFAKSQNNLEAAQAKQKTNQTPSASTQITDNRKRAEDFNNYQKAAAIAPYVGTMFGGVFANNGLVMDSVESLPAMAAAIGEAMDLQSQSVPIDEPKLTTASATLGLQANNINNAVDEYVESQPTGQLKSLARSMANHGGLLTEADRSNAEATLAANELDQSFTDSAQGNFYNEVVATQFMSYLNNRLVDQNDETANKIFKVLDKYGLVQGGFIIDTLGLDKVMLDDAEVNKGINRIFTKFLREKIEKVTTDKGTKDITIVDQAHQIAFNSVAEQAFINVINELNLPENNRSLMGPTATISLTDIDFNQPNVIEQIGNKLIANGWQSADIDNALDKFLQPQYWQQAYQQYGEARRGYTVFEAAWNLVTDNYRFLGASLQQMFSNPNASELYNKLAGQISQAKNSARSPMGQVATLIGQSHRVDTKQKEVAAQEFGNWWDSNIGSKLAPAANRAYKSALTGVLWDKLVDFSKQGDNK